MASHECIHTCMQARVICERVRRGRIFGIVVYLVNVAAHKRMNNYLSYLHAPLRTAQSQGKSAHCRQPALQQLVASADITHARTYSTWISTVDACNKMRVTSTQPAILFFRLLLRLTGISHSDNACVRARRSVCWLCFGQYSRREMDGPFLPSPQDWKKRIYPNERIRTHVQRKRERDFARLTGMACRGHARLLALSQLRTVGQWRIREEVGRSWLHACMQRKCPGKISTCSCVARRRLGCCSKVGLCCERRFA
jgi:hypothetical protein